MDYIEACLELSFRESGSVCKKGGKHLMRDGICLSLEEVVKATDTEETGLSLVN